MRTISFLSALNASWPSLQGAQEKSRRESIDSVLGSTKPLNTSIQDSRILAALKFRRITHLSPGPFLILRWRSISILSNRQSINQRTLPLYWPWCYYQIGLGYLSAHSVSALKTNYNYTLYFNFKSVLQESFISFSDVIPLHLGRSLQQIIYVLGIAFHIQ